jgi:ribonuclease BN (tRNA processing enzyme)
MTEFSLTPIGTSPAWYNPGEPTSGFLLEADGRRVLVDCGAGVIARYLEFFGDAPIDAIVLTHVHMDHCMDLIPLKYGISLGTLAHWRPQLWLPPGARERLVHLVGAWDADEAFFTDTFDVREYIPDQGFEVGPFAASALAVPHYIECFALRFEHADGAFGYTADLGPHSEIAAFMSGVDVLLAEAALAEDDDLSAADRGHITASEAGEIATAAGAHSLLLTHIPAENGLERAVDAAASAFAGPVARAISGTSVSVTQRLAV